MTQTTITPTIFIGVGGTGATIIHSIKRSLYQSPLVNDVAGSYDDWKPSFFRFLTIDIVNPKEVNANEARIQDCIDEEIARDPSESMPIHVDAAQMRELHELKTAYQNIWNWLAPSALDGVTSIHDGAGQRRMLGRTAFCMNFLTIRTRIRDLILDLKQKISQHSNESRYKLGSEANDRKIRFVVFTSLAGGTGSGCFLDLCYLIRAFQEGEFKNDCVGAEESRGLSLFALTDSVFEDATKISDFQQLNTYSSLLDLQYYGFYNGEHARYSDPYRPFGETKRIVKTFRWNVGLHDDPQKNVDWYEGVAPIANAIYLIDKTNFEGEVLKDQFDAMSMVSQFVLLKYRHPEAWKKHLEDCNNPGDSGIAISRKLVHNSTAPGQSSSPVIPITRFRGIGVSRVSARKETIRLAAAALLASDIARAWVRKSDADVVTPYDLLENATVNREVQEILEVAQSSQDFDEVFRSVVPSKLNRFDEEVAIVGQRENDKSIHRRIFGIHNNRSGCGAVDESLGLIAKRCEATLADARLCAEQQEKHQRTFEKLRQELQVLERKKTELEGVGFLSRMFIAPARSTIEGAISDKRAQLKKAAKLRLRFDLITRAISAKGVRSLYTEIERMIEDLKRLSEVVGLLGSDGVDGVPGLRAVFKAIVPTNKGTGRDIFAHGEFCQDWPGYEESYRALVSSAPDYDELERDVRRRVLDKLDGMREGDGTPDPLWRPARDGERRVADVIRKAMHLGAYHALRAVKVKGVEGVGNAETLNRLARPYIGLQPALVPAHGVRIQIDKRTVPTVRTGIDTKRLGNTHEQIAFSECVGVGLDSLDLKGQHSAWDRINPEQRPAHMSSKIPNVLGRIARSTDMTALSSRAMLALFHLVEGGVTLGEPLLAYVEDENWKSSFVLVASNGAQKRFVRFADLIEYLGQGGSQELKRLEGRYSHILGRWHEVEQEREIGYRVYRLVKFSHTLQEHFRASRGLEVVFDVNASDDREVKAEKQSVSVTTDFWYWRQLEEKLKSDFVHRYGEPNVGEGNWRLEQSSYWAPLFSANDFRTNPPFDFRFGVPEGFSNGILCLAKLDKSCQRERRIMEAFGFMVRPQEGYSPPIRAPLDDFDGSGITALKSLERDSQLPPHPKYTSGIYPCD
jgi:hypothetical protein